MLVFDIQPSHSTIEDIYTAVIETDRGVKEKVRIFDTGAAAMVRLQTNEKKGKLYHTNEGYFSTPMRSALVHQWGAIDCAR